MENFILDILKNSAADGWTVTDEVRTGWEFYFIRHKLDQNRVRSTEHISVTVYKRFGDGMFMGSASARLSPTNTREEAKALIDSLIDEAVLVKNPAYTLNEPKYQPIKAPKEIDVQAIAGDFIRAMRSVSENEHELINSYEIFTDSVTRRFISSTGIDVCDVFPSSMAEVVVNARNAQHEIELYRMYNSGSCDADSLKSEIEATLRYGRDKLVAGKTPNLSKCDVVFSTDAAVQIYSYFIDRMSAGMKVQGISDYELGKSVVEGATGDLVTVKALRQLENSSCNVGFDAEGAATRDMCIINNGIAENFYGSRMFSQLLGLEDSFIPGNFSVDGGSLSASELRYGKYLEVVEFSDFQVNPMGGDIAGEIRLGYLHDGDKMTVVEGGSVSGSMRDFAKTMRFSAEQKQYDNYLIPAVTRLYDVSLTGAEG